MHPPRKLLLYRYGLLALAFVLPMSFSGPSTADTENPAELRTKSVAQVVQGILSYARWPNDPQTLRLCIVAPTQYTDLLLSDLTTQSQRPIHTRRLLADSSQLESDCDAVYVGVLPTNDRQALFSRLLGKPILSISETGNECNEGSLFCLAVGDRQTAFKINLDAVARSGIRVHPNVLRLNKQGDAQP